MMIKVKCNSCGKSLSAKPELAGKQVKCPKCGAVLAIPYTGTKSHPPEAKSLEKKLLSAINAGDTQGLAKILSHELLWLVDSEPGADDEAAPICANVDDMQLIVAFTSQKTLQQFADNNPQFSGDDGSVEAFKVHSKDIFDRLGGQLGLLLNSEDEEAMLIDPQWAAEIGRHVQHLPAAIAKVEIPPELFPEGMDPRAEALRKKVLAKLNSKGFFPAEWLPFADLKRRLRSHKEIAGRILGLAAVFAWGSAPEEAVSSAQIKTLIKNNKLGQWLTVEEQQIIGTPRQNALAQYAGGVGWKLENMWSLAWVMGYPKAPVVAAGMIDQEIIHSLIFEFVGGFEQSVDGLVSKTQLRKSGPIIALEDYFYCAHNAVRSAQVGSAETVPLEFDPIAHGGTVHERRHALTWCLSPGVAWDETDLST